MEKIRFARLLAVTVLVCVVAGQAMAVPSIYNTGVDNGGGALAVGTADPHFSVVLPDNTAGTAVVIQPHPEWVAAPAGSRWIGVSESALGVDPVGSYVYTQTFTLVDLQPDTIVKLSGSWSTDNTSEIWLNGSFTGFARLDEFAYKSLADFEITTGFVEGLNTLEFRTVNLEAGPGPNPNGLLVANTRLIQVSPVPAPGAVLLVSLGTCAVGFIRRKGIL